MSTQTHQVINMAVKEGKVLLSEMESKQVLKDAGISTTEIMLATSAEEALRHSAAIGYPVVLKIASDDITHKSDAGGVKVGLNNDDEVSRAFEEIMTSCRDKFPQARITGVTVQNMARPGTEVIIGMTTDPQFGPVLMFGLGGVWVEVLKDVSFRIVPVSKTDAAEMIREIKGFALLQGYRGSEPADLKILEDILIKVSALVERTPQIKELDINPIFVYKDGALAADARIILEKQ